MTAATLPGLPPVAFLGLGAMGGPIARRLLAAGYPMCVFNRTAERAAALTAAGARLAGTPRAAGEFATGGHVVTLLSDAPVVRRLLFGRQGASCGAGPGTQFIDLSTIAPEQSREIAARLSLRGQSFVDAPLGGSTDAAAEGKLLIYAGGSDSDVGRARPFLAHIARRVEHLGPVGAGEAMKLVNNLVTLSQVALASEALAFAEGVGIDRRKAIELLLDGGGHSRMLEAKRDALSERRYPARFRLSLAQKDLRLIERVARETGRSVRLAREARRLVDEAVRAGLANADFSAVFEAALARGGRPASGGTSAARVPDPAPERAP